jgi:hypothetical protein
MWLSSYVKNRMQYVVADGIYSSLRKLRTGIPQGSVLGPLLFLLYINDLPNVSPHNLFILFADDTTCLTKPSDLQSVCDSINYWFSSNKLAVNVVKTKHMLFSSKNSDPPVLKMNGFVVQNVCDFKFWDVILIISSVGMYTLIMFVKKSLVRYCNVEGFIQIVPYLCEANDLFCLHLSLFDVLFGYLGLCC